MKNTTQKNQFNKFKLLLIQLVHPSIHPPSECVVGELLIGALCVKSDCVCDQQHQQLVPVMVLIDSKLLLNSSQKEREQEESIQ